MSDEIKSDQELIGQALIDEYRKETSPASLHQSLVNDFVNSQSRASIRLKPGFAIISICSLVVLWGVLSLPDDNSASPQVSDNPSLSTIRFSTAVSYTMPTLSRVGSLPRIPVVQTAGPSINQSTRPNYSDFGSGKSVL